MYKVTLYFVEGLELNFVHFLLPLLTLGPGPPGKLTVPKKKLQYIALSNIDRVINRSVSLAILTETMYY